MATRKRDPNDPRNSALNRTRRAVGDAANRVREGAAGLRDKVRGRPKPKVTLAEAQASRQGFRSQRGRPQSPEGRAARGRVESGAPGRTPPPDVTVDTTRRPGGLRRLVSGGRQLLRASPAGAAGFALESGVQEAGRTGPLSERTAEAARAGGLRSVAAFAEDSLRSVPEGVRRNFSALRDAVGGVDPEVEAAADGLSATRGGVDDPLLDSRLQGEITRTGLGGRTGNPSTALRPGTGFVRNNTTGRTQRIVSEPSGSESSQPTNQGLRESPAVNQPLARLPVGAEDSAFAGLLPFQARAIRQNIEAQGATSAADRASLINAETNRFKALNEAVNSRLENSIAGNTQVRATVEGLDLEDTEGLDVAVGRLAALNNEDAENAIAPLLVQELVRVGSSTSGERDTFDAIADFFQGRSLDVPLDLSNVVIRDGEVFVRTGGGDRIVGDLDEFSNNVRQEILKRGTREGLTGLRGG